MAPAAEAARLNLTSIQQITDRLSRILLQIYSCCRCDARDAVASRPDERVFASSPSLEFPVQLERVCDVMIRR